MKLIDLKEELNSFSIVSILDCIGVKYRIVNNGNFEMFFDNEYKTSYTGNITKNIIKDHTGKERPSGRPYKFLEEYIEYNNLDIDILDFFTENKGKFALSGNSSFHMDETKYTIGEGYTIAETEQVHPLVSFTADDLLNNLKKFALPLPQIEKLEARGIKRETLIGEDIFYGSITENNIPALLFIAKNGLGDPIGIKIRNLFAKNSKFKSLSLTHSRVGLFYNKKYLQKDNVYICEGEMDYFILRQMGYANVLGNMGGVQSFMRDWLLLMKGKNIYILYDNDKAGTLGTNKLINIIQNEIKGEYKSLNVSSFGNPGEDINDTYLRLRKTGMKDLDIGKMLFNSMKSI